MKSSEWMIYSPRRLWLLLLLGQSAIFWIVYLFFGKAAFFLLAPMALFNAVLYIFPYWYMWQPTGTPSKSLKFQHFAKEAQRHLSDDGLKLHVHLTEENFENIFILAHRKNIWLQSSVEFISRFDHHERDILLREIRHLYDLGRLQTATFFSALQLMVPWGLWRHNRGAELTFYAPNKTKEWHELNFKVLQWNTLHPQSVKPFLMPCLVYPALTNYSQASYSSAYTYMRERLIHSLKDHKENPLEH